MTSFICLNYAMILLSLFVPRSASQHNLPPSTGSETTQNINDAKALNPADGSNICKLRINKLEIEEIVRSMKNYATHVVEITVSVMSENKTRVFSDFKWSWASEIGRTIITLKGQTTDVFSKFIPISRKNFHHIILEHGIEEVNVVIFEGNYGCLQGRSNAWKFVFEFLLHQLSHSTDKHDYTLCRANSNNVVKQYDCCRAVGRQKLTICVEYPSPLLEHGGRYTTAIVFLFVLVILPLIRHFLQSMPNEKEYYTTTESPMAIERILFTWFIEGSDNVIVSFFRRLAFSLAVVAILMISFSEWPCIVMSLIWAIIFTQYDLWGLNENRYQVDTYKTYLIILTSPFNIKFLWNRFPSTHLNPQQRARVCPIGLIQFFINFFWGVFYTVFVVLICVICVICVLCLSLFLTLVSASFKVMKRFDDTNEGNYWVLLKQNKCIFLFWAIWEIFSCVIMTAFAYSGFVLVLYLVAGFYLNGSFFSPIAVPLLVLLVYAWNAWKWCVEMEYFLLKAKIYEVCEEYYENSTSRPSSPTTSSSQLFRLVSGNTVNVKEGTVSKPLYDRIRENILPYNEVFFNFFVRMFFVTNFCLAVVVMMYLAQRSNDEAVPAQIMSTILISTIPLFYITIMGGHGTERREAKGKKIKQALTEIMAMEVSTDNTVTVNLTFKEETRNLDDVLNELRGLHFDRYLA